MNRNGIDRKRRTGAYRDERFDASDGQREPLLGALRECYGISHSEAEFRFRQCVYGTEVGPEAEAESVIELRLTH